MHSYSHVNANYRAAPFAVGTNGKVRGTHIDGRRGRVVGPAGIVALLRSIDRSTYQSIGRFVTAIDLGDRSGIVTRVVAFCHAAAHRQFSICQISLVKYISVELIRDTIDGPINS